MFQRSNGVKLILCILRVWSLSFILASFDLVHHILASEDPSIYDNRLVTVDLKTTNMIGLYHSPSWTS